MASIQETLNAALLADSTLSGLIGTRLFPGQIPDDQDTPPWLYYAVPESVPLDQLDDGGDDVRSELEFHALADRYSAAKAIVDAVRSVMNSFRGGVIRLATWAGTSEETTEDGYHHAIRFVVWWNTAG